MSNGNELIVRDDNLLIGKVMKLVQARTPNVVEVVEVLWIEHGLIRLRFLERSRKPVLWMPLIAVQELRETEGNAL